MAEASASRQDTPFRWWQQRRWRLALGLSLGLPCLIFFCLVLVTRPYARLVLPEPSLFLEDRQGQFLSEVGEGPLGFWPVDSVPERLEQCLLIAEDRRFYQHRGVDFRALGRALHNNFQGKPRQGASTLPMQIARLQRPGSRTYPRKLLEMFTAWQLVQRYEHHELLRHYLAIMPQGRRIHGAAYASRRYFQKPLVDISWAEAALLAALPRGPGRMNFYKAKGLNHAKQRAALILGMLHESGSLPSQPYQAALTQLRQFQPPTRETRPFHAIHAIHQAQAALASHTHLNRERPIQTTLDLKLQEVVDDLAAKALERVRGFGAGNVAAMVVERQTGHIKSYVGSDWYDDQDHAGAINYANTPRSSGSTLKPFIYALALEKGHLQPQSILADLPLLSVDQSGHYGVSNFDDSYLGPMLVRQALANSRNIPAVSLLRRQGVLATYDFLHDLGLADNTKSADFYGLGMAIGGVYVTLEALMQAYGVLANDGAPFRLHWFPPPAQEKGPQLMSESTARFITQVLADPQARQPTFPRDGALEYAFPVAVKTGTSQGFRDAWCLAFSREYIVGVWFGRPDHQPMNKVSGAHAAELVHRIMTFLHPEALQGIGIQPFPQPRQTEPVRLCSLSGHRAVADCDRVAVEYLPTIRKPLPWTQVHRRFAVDRKTGHLAGLATPSQRVQIRKALVLPSEYAVWASRQSLNPPLPPQQDSQKVRLQIQTPIDRSRLHMDPSTPQAFQTLPLRAEVEPAVSHVVWYVNGKPFRKVGFPFEVRWPLEPGTHQFQVRLPHAQVHSAIVTVTVFP